MSLSFSVSRVLFTCALGFAALVNNAFAEEDKVVVTEDSFRCLHEMTAVRGFFVDNLLGDLEATLAIANSSDGGRYPPGSVIQLVPGEAMVKLQKGASPATRDWEFFELDGNTIAKRGFDDVVNRFGGNCLACHVKAKPEWDLVCETGHGCDPLPLSKDMLTVIQKTDSRCSKKPELSAQELQLLGNLQKMLGTNTQAKP